MKIKGIELDTSKLLGFRLVAANGQHREVVVGAKTGGKPSPTIANHAGIGAKIGSKLGVKGSKVGVKPGSPSQF